MAITYEQLKAVNDSINKVSIKGKDYAQVNDRVKAFRQVCPMGMIQTEIIALENGIVTMKATISDEEGRVLATGLAQEKESSSFINKTSYIENCETSAVGRALGFAGIGVDGSMASAEEVANAIINQNKSDYPTRKEMLETVQASYPDGSENLNKLLECFKVKALNKLTDEQLKTVYNKVHK